jgi:hypothetical protein
MRWARIALCTFAVSLAVVGALPASAATGRANSARQASAPPLVLTGQTAWVEPTAPWFNLNTDVGDAAVPTRELHVTITIYSRINSPSELQQDTNSTPHDELTRVTVPVMQTASGRVADGCVTVLPDQSATPPASTGTIGACPPGGNTVVLGCTPDDGSCGDVYPVSVALLRSGQSSPVSRFTTFLTYQEPGVESATGGQLRVALVMPLTVSPSSTSPSAADRTRFAAVADELADHQGVFATLEIDPQLAADVQTHGGRAGRRALNELTSLTTAPQPDQVLALPYAKLNLAALTAAGLTDELTMQMSRGSSALHQAGVHASGGPWVDTDSVFSTADAGALAAGLQAVHADHLVLNGSDLSTGGASDETFAQPFTLSLGHQHVTAAATDSLVDSRFTAFPSNPILAANQLLATLSFVHFENAFFEQARGLVVDPPSGWVPSAAFDDVVLQGLSGNPALSPVTVSQLFSQVPIGGNSEPSSRHLANGSVPRSGTISAATALRITTDRSRLRSFAGAVLGHPDVLASFSDSLLDTEGVLTPSERTAALNAYGQRFDALLDTISLAAEHTITFTSRTAAIPITVLHTAPYNVKVVLSLDSDKFTFPSGTSRTLVLDRPTTPVRVEARARSSGDGLPVDVTLRTPDGQLLIAHATVAVHSTSISIVGVALTVLAGLTLLLWWGRTWRASRRQRPRAHGR